MIVPLPEGIAGVKDLPKLKEHMINLIKVGDGWVRTPGIDSLATGFGVCRAVTKWFVDDQCYMVSGNTFIRILSDGRIESLGTINGETDCVFSQGQVNLVVIVKGGAGYRYNNTEGLVEINDPDFYPSVDVDFIDGRHVFIPEDGEPAFYSDVDSAGSIEPLAFFDAEELPDRNKAVINVQNQLYIGGSDSFEIFRTNVDPDLVFVRRDGGRVDIGYVAGKTRYANTFAFLGRKRGEAYRFYVMSSGNAVGISNSSIDEILNTEYTEAELKNCEGYRYEWLGVELLLFTLSRHSFTFVNGIWVYQTSDITGDIASNWRVKGIAHAYGKYIVGDRKGSSIGILSHSPSEYGEDVEMEVKTFIRSERNAFIQLSKVELDCLGGQKLDEETIGISTSKDGFLWTAFFYRGLGSKGRYRSLVRWQPPGGFGVSENFVGLRFRSTADVSFGLESVQAE